jgi:hypothetical protein
MWCNGPKPILCNPKGTLEIGFGLFAQLETLSETLETFETII